MTTTNHGLAGGTLDATKHIEVALPRLCSPTEIRDYRETILPAPVIVGEQKLN